MHVSQQSDILIAQLDRVLGGATGDSKNENRSTTFNLTENGRPIGHFCQKIGHIKAKCFKLKAINARQMQEN